MEGNHVEPVEKILAEIAALDLVLEILVGGGHDPHVDLHELGRADRLEALLIEGAQHFGLRPQAHVADLVEKQRPAVRLLKFSDLGFVRVGEAAAAVAEQLALDHVFGNGGAVDLDERLLGAGAQGVDGVGDQLLARAALAENQHAAVGARHESHLLAQRLHRHAFADDAVPRLAAPRSRLFSI